MAMAISRDDGLTWTDLGDIITGVDPARPGAITGEGDCTMLDGGDGHAYAYCLRNSEFAHHRRTGFTRQPRAGKLAQVLRRSAGTGTRLAARRQLLASSALPPPISRASAGSPLSSPIPGSTASACRCRRTGCSSPISPNRCCPSMARTGTVRRRPTSSPISACSIRRTAQHGRQRLFPRHGLSRAWRHLRASLSGLSARDDCPRRGACVAAGRHRPRPLAKLDRRHFSRNHRPGCSEGRQPRQAPRIPDDARARWRRLGQAGGMPGRPRLPARCRRRVRRRRLTRLRTAGWAYDQPHAGTLPLYRCAASGGTFISNDPTCEGRGSVETRLGFALSN